MLKNLKSLAKASDWIINEIIKNLKNKDKNENKNEFENSKSDTLKNNSLNIHEIDKNISSLKQNMLKQWKKITEEFSKNVEPIKTYPELVYFKKLNENRKFNKDCFIINNIYNDENKADRNNYTENNIDCEDINNDCNNNNKSDNTYLHILTINLLMNFTNAVDSYLNEIKEKNPNSYPECIKFYEKSILKNKILDDISKNKFESLELFVKDHYFETKLVYLYKIIIFLEIIKKNIFLAIDFLQNNFKNEELVRPFVKALVGKKLQINYKKELINELIIVFKRNYDIPPNIPIIDLYEAGVISFPLITSMCKNPRLMKCGSKNELPIELPIPHKMKYHSFFVCPVLKVRCGNNNMPLLLKCGHVISEKAVKEIAGSNIRFKCPYCPVVSHLNDLKVIKL
ncbi:LisH domain-containing protein C29A3.03c [Dictyocoela muelleri]|nr:LisH domain-containing protein C29A3.03c [Dictyocoela muelleri]